MVFVPELFWPAAIAVVLDVALIGLLLWKGIDRPVNRALALFALAWGGQMMGGAMSGAGLDPNGVWGAFATRFYFADGLFVAYLAFVYPERRPGAPRILAWTSTYLAAWAAFEWARVLRPDWFEFPKADPLSIIDIAFDLAHALAPLVLVLDSTRDPTPRFRSTLLLAVGVGFGFAVSDGAALTARALVPPDADGSRLYLAAEVVRWLLRIAILVILVRAARDRPERRRAHVATAVALFGAGLAGSALVLLDPARTSAVRDAVFLTAYAVVTPTLMAYAILRHQLLDIDVKIKIGLTRGALAGIFLAVFFVAAQLAQNYLSQTGGLLVGGVVTGLLLFALAPLQRVAERFADRAMPGVGHAVALRRGADGSADPSSARADINSKERAYKNAVRFALDDRVLTRDEEMQLAHLADELGLSAQQATRLRHDVEAETRPATSQPDS